MWERANCRKSDPNIFFPNNDDKNIEILAKNVCNNCPVIDLCLELGLVLNVQGIWGGTNALERKRIRRQRRIRGSNNDN